jgi:tryptophan-rich sensory protein
VSFSTQKQLLGLVVSIVVCFTVAAIGAAASVNAGTFYLQLTRPPWAPPASIFGPVWTLLFAAMAVSAWLVWRCNGFGKAHLPLALFLVQLALNALWSWLFFAWHQGAIALADIILLWLLVAATLATFWRIRPLAGALLLPYLAWITFAAVLNYSVWQLNPQSLG